MKTSFQNVPNNTFSRNFGGTTIGIAEPYVSGYHHIFFERIPAKLEDYVKVTGSQGDLQKAEIVSLLSASCLSVTPPGGTLNKVSFTGLGGTKWAVPGNADYGDSVSIKFLEYSGLPIISIFHGWVRMIRDYRSGATNLDVGDDRAGYNKSTYAGLLYYWTTAPDGETIEYFACYDGVFPLKDPQDLLASDVESVGKIEPEIEFNVDYIWHEDWVKDAIQSFTGNLSGHKDTLLKRDARQS